MKCSVSKEVKRVYGGRNVMPTTLMGMFHLLESNLRKAAEYDPEKEGVEPDEKLAAIRMAIDGEMPMMISCDDANSRQLVMEIVKPYEKMKVIFTMMAGLSELDLTLDPERVSFIDGFAGGDSDPRSMHKDYRIIKALVDKGMRIAVCGKTAPEATAASGCFGRAWS